jgi:hypothetical protein
MADKLQYLVLLMVILAVAGTVVGGIYYYAVELPLQKSAMEPQDQPAPANSNYFNGNNKIPPTPAPGR